MNKKIENLAQKQYFDADWHNHFSDWTKEAYQHISFDSDWLYNCFRLAYESGFEEGFHTANGTPTDEFGNFILENNK